MSGVVPGHENHRLRTVRFDFAFLDVFQTVNLPGDGDDGDAQHDEDHHLQGDDHHQAVTRHANA